MLESSSGPWTGWTGVVWSCTLSHVSICWLQVKPYKFLFTTGFSDKKYSTMNLLWRRLQHRVKCIRVVCMWINDILSFHLSVYIFRHRKTIISAYIFFNKFQLRWLCPISDARNQWHVSSLKSDLKFSQQLNGIVSLSDLLCEYGKHNRSPKKISL